MKVLKYLQNPSDLPWIIISQLILALTVAHFGAVMNDSFQNQDLEDQEIQQEESKQASNTIYIIKMGDNPGQCIVSSVDGTVIADLPIEELDISVLDGKPIVDLSLSKDKQKFFGNLSKKFQTNNRNMSLAYLAE